MNNNVVIVGTPFPATTYYLFMLFSFPDFVYVFRSNIHLNVLNFTLEYRKDFKNPGLLS